MAKSPTAVAIIDVQKRRNPSKHYVYVINVTWSDGSVVTVYRRYSAFFDFHVRLLEEFPLDAGDGEGIDSKRIIPFLPGKKLFGRSHIEKVAKSRINLLEEYLKALLECPPRIKDSRTVLDFLEPNTLDIKPPSQDEREKKSVGASASAGVSGLMDRVMGKTTGDDKQLAAKHMQIGEVLILDQYRAVAEYKKTNKTELTFKTGDVFEVIEKNDNGWWFVSNNESEEQGWVPATFLEPLDAPDDEEEHSNPQPGTDEKYISTSAYKAAHSDEISFEKNSIIIVLEKKLDGWWRVEYQGKEGWAPGSYLEKIAQYVPDEKKSSEPAKPPRPEAPSQAKKQVEPPLRRSSIHGEKGPFAFVASAAAAGKKTGASTLQVPGAEVPAPVPAPAPAKPSAPARPSAPVKPEPPKAVERPAQAAAVVLPPKPSKPEVPPSPVGGVVAALKAKQESEAAKPVLPAKKPAAEPAPAPKPAAVASTTTAAAAAAATPAKPGAEKCECISAYKGESDTEATLSQGEVVTLLEKAETGWWFVQKSNGSEGWVPSDFLKIVPAAGKPAVAAAKPAVAGAKPTLPSKPAAAPAEDTETFVSTADHNAETKEEMSLKKGDVVTLLDKADGWWFVKKGAQEGWVPSTFLEPNTKKGAAVPAVGAKAAAGASSGTKALVENVSCKRAYRGKKSRPACEAALKSGRNRDFIVRDSETTAGCYTISMRVGTEIHHFKIDRKGARYAVGEVDFAEVDEAIEYFLKHPIYTSPSGEGVMLGSAFVGNV